MPAEDATLAKEPGVRHPKLRARRWPRWEASEYARAANLDAEIAAELGVTTRWARAIRASWAHQEGGIL